MEKHRQNHAQCHPSPHVPGRSALKKALTLFSRKSVDIFSEGVQGFAPFLSAVELHHENWDGTGYPKGQRRCETPIDARIIHVADAYDAMTTNRSYRSGMTHEAAIAELMKYSGIQFDPEIVAAFVKLPLDVLMVKSPSEEAPVETEEMAEVKVG